MFRELTGDTAVIAHRGTYRVAQLFEWQNGIYARIGNGYVRLYHNGTTSRDGFRLIHMTWDRPLFADKFGRLTTTGNDPIPLPGVTE